MMDFTKNTDAYGRKVMAEDTWTPENGNHAKVQLTQDIHGHQFVMVSIPGLSTDIMVEWSSHGLDETAAMDSFRKRVEWTELAYQGMAGWPTVPTNS